MSIEEKLDKLTQRLDHLVPDHPIHKKEEPNK